MTILSPDIIAYNHKFSPAEYNICSSLAELICTQIPHAENKIWHAHPVWFIDGNPIVGYSVLKNGVRLLFWSGQTFDEPALLPEGKFKAAEIRYQNVHQINNADLQRWLYKATIIQWDYKNIVKRKGRLERLH